MGHGHHSAGGRGGLLGIGLVWMLTTVAVSGCLDPSQGTVSQRARLEVTPLGCTPEPLRGWVGVREITRDAATGRLEVTFWNTMGGMCDGLVGDWVVDDHVLTLFYGGADDACTEAARTTCGDDANTAVRLTLTAPLASLPEMAGLAVTAGTTAPDYANLILPQEALATRVDVNDTLLRVDALLDAQLDADGNAEALVRAAHVLDSGCADLRSHLQIKPDNSAVIVHEVGAGCAPAESSAAVTTPLAFLASAGGNQPRVMLARDTSGDGFVAIALPDWN